MATACTPVNLEIKLKEITDPYLFGVHLGIESKDLEQIEKNHRGDVARQRSEVIKFWYNNAEESGHTWGRVADALQTLGSHRNLESQLRKLDNPSTASGHANGSGSSEVRSAGAKPPALASASPTVFSDALSPTDLVSWLSQQFQAKGLTLDPTLGKNLIDEDINGEAFVELTDNDLSEMGFKKGQRMKMLKIISSVKKVGEANNHSEKHQTVPGSTQEEESTQASGGVPDFSGLKLKEITNSFLDLIEWNEGADKIRLRIYSMTAANWKNIARKLGLEDTIPGFTNSMAKQHRDDDRECVIQVFGKWLENANGLPYAKRYPKSWEGLHTLLVDSELGEVAKKALHSSQCS